MTNPSLVEPFAKLSLLLHAKNASIPLDPNDMKGSFKDISQRMVDVIKEYYS